MHPSKGSTRIVPELQVGWMAAYWQTYQPENACPKGLIAESIQAGYFYYQDATLAYKKISTIPTCVKCPKRYPIEHPDAIAGW